MAYIPCRQNLYKLQKDEQRAEQDIKDKEKQIDQLSEENNTDNLNGSYR